MRIILSYKMLYLIICISMAVFTTHGNEMFKYCTDSEVYFVLKLTLWTCDVFQSHGVGQL